MAASAASPRRFGFPATRRGRANLAQVLGAVALLIVLALLSHTLADNLERLNLTAGFGFLLRPAGMRMGESAIPFDPSDSFLWAMVVAGLNTVRVAVAAVVLATVLGTAVGVMRLSDNPLLRAITGVYVELFRNTPLLLQILFWSALLLKLPAIKQAIGLGGGVFLSQRGLTMPALIVAWDQAAPAALGALAAALLVWAALRRRRGFGLALAGIVALLLTWLARQGAMGVDWPVRKLFGFTGGMTLTPEFCALTAGLTAYTGAFIAEIVRAGILSVPAGQIEAARSLGLRGGTILRKIVLPQALRVILPAITAQYVGIIKNSSLAIAIGFPDLFWAVSTAINVTGHAVEGVVVLMAGYLVLTLGVSGAMNLWYGRMLRQGAAR